MEILKNLPPHHTPGSLDLPPKWMHIPNQGLLSRWGSETFSGQRSVALEEIEFQGLDSHITGHTLGEPDLLTQRLPMSSQPENPALWSTLKEGTPGSLPNLPLDLSSIRKET